MTFTPVCAVNSSSSFCGITYGTITVIVWPLIDSLAPPPLLLPPPLDPPQDAANDARPSTAVTRNAARLRPFTAIVLPRFAARDRERGAILRNLWGKHKSAVAHLIRSIRWTRARSPTAARIARDDERFGALSGDCRFITIALAEPHKQAVLDWEAGGAPPAA